MFFNNKNLMLRWWKQAVIFYEKIKKDKEKKETPTWFLLLVFLGVVVIFSWAVFCYLGLNLSDLREMGMGGTNKEKLIERAFTIIGGGVAVLGLLALIWRSILMERQTEISQKSQYTEQFLKSVEQTASEKLEICLGGLASLDALSRENKVEYRRVWKYLGEFLRYHKPLKDEGEKTYPKVNAIAKMLRERKREYEYEDFKLDLSEAHLEEANLYKVHLEGAKLEGANLVRANLKEANLVGANLVGTKLEGANLVGANLEGAILIKANLEGAILSGANLSKALLWDVNLEEAILRDMNLEGTSLYNMDLVEANLVRANLKEANLEGVNLEGASLEGADLVGAALRDANLEGANLEEALFGGMESGEPQDLRRLTPEQLRGTYYDKDRPMPTLPDGISDDDKPQPISYSEWAKEYRPKIEN